MKLALRLTLLVLVGWAFLSLTKTSTAPPELVPVSIGDIESAHRKGNILLAGQPAQADLQTLKDRGYGTIINLRKEDEIHWDESAVAQELKLRYVHLPFQNADELTDDLFDEAITTLSEQDLGPTLLHCGSCNRVGAIWYAYRVLEEGATAEEAEQEARAAGMRSSWLLDTAQDYVRRHQGSR